MGIELNCHEPNEIEKAPFTDSHIHKSCNKLFCISHSQWSFCLHRLSFSYRLTAYTVATYSKQTWLWWWMELYTSHNNLLLKHIWSPLWCTHAVTCRPIFSSDSYYFQTWLFHSLSRNWQLLEHAGMKTSNTSFIKPIHHKHILSHGLYLNSKTHNISLPLPGTFSRPALIFRK